MFEDILQEIADEDLDLLLELYKQYREKLPQAYGALDVCIRWKRQKGTKIPLRLFRIVNEDLLKNGTFICILEYSCNYMFFFTLREDLQNSYQVLTTTKKINWDATTIWFIVPSRDIPTAIKINECLKKYPYDCQDGSLWMIEKEKASQFQIKLPDHVYLGPLNESHVPLVNDQWPHKHAGSNAFLRDAINMSDTYGLFLKSNDSLVCWVIRNFIGMISNLQTVSEHKRNGYAVLITKVIAREIAAQGHNPVACIMKGNVQSEKLFVKLGFWKYDDCTFIFTNKKDNF